MAPAVRLVEGAALAAEHEQPVAVVELDVDVLGDRVLAGRLLVGGVGVVPEDAVGQVVADQHVADRDVLGVGDLDPVVGGVADRVLGVLALEDHLAGVLAGALDRQPVELLAERLDALDVLARLDLDHVVLLVGLAGLVDGLLNRPVLAAVLTDHECLVLVLAALAGDCGRGDGEHRDGEERGGDADDQTTIHGSPDWALSGGPTRPPGTSTDGRRRSCALPQFVLRL